MNSTGRKTAASDNVMDRIVKPISFAPASAASNTPLPFSMCRTIFSSMTIASSTTNPTESVNAIRERLSSEKPDRYMTAKVPTNERGRARLGITVADRLRRKRKITSTTRKSAISSVNLTSSTELRIVRERS